MPGYAVHRVRPLLRAIGGIARRSASKSVGLASAATASAAPSGNRAVIMPRHLSRAAYSTVVEFASARLGPLSLLEVKARLANDPRAGAARADGGAGAVVVGAHRCGGGAKAPRRGEEWGRTRLVTRMPCNVTEGSDAYVLRAELPGVPRENIKVEIQDDAILSISAHQERISEQGRVMFVQEYVRQIRFPPSVDRTAISATSKDGILTVRIGKQSSKIIQIDVTDEDTVEIPSIHAHLIEEDTKE